MAIKLSCPEGHRWEVDAANDPRTQETCPVCGAGGETVIENSAPPLQSHDQLPPPPRDGASPADARDGETLLSNPAAESELPEVLGRYQIVKLIGRGGMGVVYLARDTELERQVALKVPHSSITRDVNLLQRFQREARAAAKLDHPNICSVYDVGQIEGTHYLAMAYVEGRSLSKLIKDQHPLPQVAVADLVHRLASAMQEAHTAGIVHRDLKPDNVMVNQRHEPVIMDFGLARREGSPDAKLTAEGAVMGSPAYMSPEQVAGQSDRIGPATDIYALGVILYELLTGRLPFEGSIGEVMGKISTQPPLSPSQYRPDIDSGLEEICLKAFSKNVEDRFTSMGELAGAISDFLDTHQGRSSEQVSAAGASDANLEPDTSESLARASDLLESLVARLESVENRAASQVTVNRGIRGVWPFVAVASAAVVLLGLFLWAPWQPPEPSEIVVHIDARTWLQDQTVVFLVDGRAVTREELTRQRLEPGKHKLTVKRDEEILQERVFTVSGETSEQVVVLRQEQVSDDETTKQVVASDSPLVGLWRYRKSNAIVRITRRGDGTFDEHNVRLSADGASAGYYVGEHVGQITSGVDGTLEFKAKWRYAGREPEWRTFRASFDEGTIRYSEVDFGDVVLERHDIAWDVDEMFSRRSSALSAVVVDPLKLKGFPSIGRLYIVPVGGRLDYHALGASGTDKIGDPVFVEPGQYNIAYKPLQGGGSGSATVLLYGLQVVAGETVTVHTDKMAAGILVKPMQGLEPEGFWVVGHGGARDRWRIDTHSYHSAKTDGFGKVMVVTAGEYYDVLVDLGQENMLLAGRGAERLYAKPGRLHVVGNDE